MALVFVFVFHINVENNACLRIRVGAVLLQPKSTFAEISLFTYIPTSVINKAEDRDPYLQSLSRTNHSSHTSPLVTHSVQHLTFVPRPQDAR